MIEKIEQAIDALSDMSKHVQAEVDEAGWIDLALDKELITAVQIALTALREQAEREKGCEHCRGWDARCGANFCPMCGRKLTEQEGTNHVK